VTATGGAGGDLALDESDFLEFREAVAQHALRQGRERGVQFAEAGRALEEEVDEGPVQRLPRRLKTSSV
jgi:hypothetical protein